VLAVQVKSIVIDAAEARTSLEMTSRKSQSC